MLQQTRRAGAMWLDVTWAALLGLNLLAVRLIPAWHTVPYLIVWMSLTAIYGVRLWRLGSAILTVAAVTVATAALIGSQALGGREGLEYLSAVALLAVMFVVMVLHAGRGQSAVDQGRRSLEQQRRFLQDASHELGTPITIALGHAELIERAAQDPVTVEGARVAVDELLRLRRLASRLLLLATAERPDFLELRPVEASDLVADVLSRWSQIPRAWSLRVLEDATVLGDHDRLVLALDALIENAVHHTGPTDRIELGVRRERTAVVIHIADSGGGIPPAELGRIFERFSRVDASRNREAGGFGLGLAIVEAIAGAHAGSVRVRSNVGQGSVFEVRLPVATAPGRQSMVASSTATRHRNVQ